jgi:hypothetical protein
VTTEPRPAAAGREHRRDYYYFIFYSAAIRAEIEMLRERLAEKGVLIDDLREDRDRWREQATRLLPAPQPSRVGAGGDGCWPRGHRRGEAPACLSRARGRRQNFQRK